MPDLTIGRLRGGFCVSWKDDTTGKRRRHQLAARSRKDAEREAIDVYRHHTFDPGDTTIDGLLRVYRDSLDGKPSGKTLGYLMPALCGHFGHLRPDQVTRDHCADYGAARERAGRSPGTVHTELGYLRSAMRYAEKCRLIDRAPHIWRPSKPIPKERFLDRNEIPKLIDACAAPHIRLAVVLLLGTAARVGAILDLEWSRVDLERGQINLRLDDATTRKGRAIVPMNGMTRAALQTARDAALSDYVVEYGGERVRSIRNGFSAACRRAGLEGVTLHTLRHTAAVHMAEAGIPLSKISQYLGHSNSAITEKVYSRFAPSHMQDAADVLDFTKPRKVR
ncbi:tyrosine-type recombinase/integrase [Roseicyclus sp.]|uniref:tyrosine-type recombinase/integrase n=1 Tax=Roseicyclus sp. TaxID=1914329 RepID=UPI003F6D926A